VVPLGPSQEIYYEIKKLREESKKPIVAVSTGLLASGAYYSAVAADKIVVAPGALVGSIGVIMEFANLEKLYEWAKISRYSVTTGRYKDSGAEYRPMRDDERVLFQELANEVFGQFKAAVSEGRKMEDSVLSQYADGRVMTGASAVKLGFADEVGTLSVAFETAAKLAGLEKDKYEILEPKKERPSIFEYSFGLDDENTEAKSAVEMFKSVLRLDLLNQPLFLMPGIL
jgi:protease-4